VGRTARFAWLWILPTEFPCAPLAQRDAAAAALVAAVLPRPANRLVARLMAAEIVRAFDTGRNADAATVGAARRTFDAEHGGAGIDVVLNADPGAVRAAGIWIAAIPFGIDAGIAGRAGNAGDPPAHAAWLTDLRPSRGQPRPGADDSRREDRKDSAP
jgi:hypothetical protein